jgi:methylmalonyl-CoA mutase
MIVALEAGQPQRDIASAAAIRRNRIARRIQPITGVSAFPDLCEAPVAILLSAPIAIDANQPALERLYCAVLPSYRDAEPFERLRAAADAELFRKGSRPQVFLASLGEQSGFLASAHFARNLFAAAGIEAAGIEAAESEGLETSVAASDAFHRSGCRIACICASDPIPLEAVTAAAEALRAAGAEKIFLATPSGEGDDVLGVPGITDIIRPGCDALAILEALATIAFTSNDIQRPMDEGA